MTAPIVAVGIAAAAVTIPAVIGAVDRAHAAEVRAAVITACKHEVESNMNMNAMDLKFGAMAPSPVTNPQFLLIQMAPKPVVPGHSGIAAFWIKSQVEYIGDDGAPVPNQVNCLIAVKDDKVDDAGSYALVGS